MPFLYVAFVVLVALAVLGLVVHWLRWLGDEAAMAVGCARSAKWPALRRKYLALHPHCAACGSSEEVEVHHIRPFHLHPDLELDSENLVSLCNKHGCHFAFGHNYDWAAYNSHVGEDARIQAMRTKQRKYE